MKRVTLVAACLAVGCVGEPAVDPPVAPQVDIHLDVDGTLYGDLDAPIPEESQQVTIVADITAPAGQWNLVLSADGALALQRTDGADKSTLTVSVTTGGAMVRVQVPARIAPSATEGFVHVQIGSFQQDFDFHLVAPTPLVIVKREEQNGQLLEDLSAPIWTHSEVPSGDGGIETYAFNKSGASGLMMGDQLLISVSPMPAPDVAGVVWKGTLTTEGSIRFDVDGGLKALAALRFTSSSPQALVPAVVVGPGSGLVTATIENGAAVTKLLPTSEPAWIAPRRVKFVGFAGTAAVNQVTLCSTRVAGSISVALSNSGDSVQPSTAALQNRPDGPCPSEFSDAEFVWTGREDSTVWTVTDETSGASVAFSIPGLETAISVEAAVESSPSWVDSPKLADGGIPPTATEVVLVKFTRSSGATDAGTKTSLAGVPVALQAAPGVHVIPTQATTDADGFASFLITVSKRLISVSLTATVAGILVEHPLSLPGPG